MICLESLPFYVPVLWLECCSPNPNWRTGEIWFYLDFNLLDIDSHKAVEVEEVSLISLNSLALI